MIQYDFGRWGVRFVFSLAGSVFPTAVVFALPCAAISVGLWFMFEEIFQGEKPKLEGAKILFNNYSFVLGFLLVFRTQIAYSRFWEGGSILHNMRSAWLNVTSSLMAFSTDDASKKHMVDTFSHLLIRLMSIMHCAALQEVAEMADENFDIISCEGIDDASMVYLVSLSSAERVEVIMQWIQRLIVTSQANGVISSPPPIVSRCFQELANGRLSFNAAKKIADFPFPFPYAQMLMVMLVIHWLIAPIMAAMLLDDYGTCALATFVTSLAFWCINYIAAELEMPFGDDPNDLPVEQLQVSFNVSLRRLMTPAVQSLPSFAYQKDTHMAFEYKKMRQVEEQFQGPKQTGFPTSTSKRSRKTRPTGAAGLDASSQSPRLGPKAVFDLDKDKAPIEEKMGAILAIPPANANPEFPHVPYSPEEANSLKYDHELASLRTGVEERLSKIVQELVKLLVPAANARPGLGEVSFVDAGSPMHASLATECILSPARE